GESYRSCWRHESVERGGKRNQLLADEWIAVLVERADNRRSHIMACAVAHLQAGQDRCTCIDVDGAIGAGLAAQIHGSVGKYRLRLLRVSFVVAVSSESQCKNQQGCDGD